jgi:bifunctional non-homologous end joining protein LigD
MLATIGSELPHSGDWVFEPKYDGIRVLAYATKAGPRLVSRNGLDKTRQFPEVADALVALFARRRKPFVLDGEIVALDGDAPARFQELQSRMHVIDGSAIEHHRSNSPAAFIAFDVLLDDDETLVTEPWRVRREHLAALLHPPGRSNALRLSDVSTDGPAMLREARRHEWEGVIAKRADAPYELGRRSRNWVKLKIERRQELVVGGYTEPRNSREHFGAILLGYYDHGGTLVYAGHTGTGFNRESLRDMYARLARLERKTSPFTPAPRTNERPHWVRPSIVVEVKFNEWTADGKLRQPVFIGIRDDKDPREVVRESASIAVNSNQTRVRRNGRRPSTAGIVERLREIEADGGSGVLELPTGTLAVSNLDKTFFPATKQTKGDLMRYYAEIAPFILPTIADRPLVMKRFPNGVRGKAFYQQRAPADPPAGVRVERVKDEGLTPQLRLIGGDLVTLLYVIQLGAISIDPWHSRVQSVQMADYSIIDLDPGPRAAFGRVIEVAQAVREVLDRLKLHAVPKTSGASGLHVVIPLPRGVPNDGARMVAELVATMVAERHPKIATIERWVRSRPPRAIYVDYLQNIRGKTVAGVYSARAEPTATVSTPLSWDEITGDLDPRAFTIASVPARVREVGDLWAEGMRRANSLDRLVANV